MGVDGGDGDGGGGGDGVGWVRASCFGLIIKKMYVVDRADGGYINIAMIV